MKLSDSAAQEILLGYANLSSSDLHDLIIQRAGCWLVNTTAKVRYSFDQLDRAVDVLRHSKWLEDYLEIIALPCFVKDSETERTIRAEQLRMKKEGEK